ncbi:MULTISPECIES: DUF3467 domain-containing protein [Sphingomonas]|jgi:hypothetical protein|uniref:DUF3467 domain-containing protein n=1 Tax=Sphingomonas leidyi TaxID=68569 RepID=A0A7X5V171_9SPHN|nr:MULTISPECIES: DUF3467 domain-containing protein [Sphingomonas]MBN8809816.1 hypothetical protein [Sphingomonas sp.]NIJ66021.1 hypothetical protein [Sphingomonas leidyi]OJY50435.1 MAG: hypothetical protein BGP17_18460 [Sphingomonas sp. 67-41]
MNQGSVADRDADPAMRAETSRAPASYVNYFELGQNPFEFLIDLGQYYPSGNEGVGAIAIHTRLVLTPPYAKMLSELLARSVHEHERENGPVAQIGQESCPFDIVLSSIGDFEERARALRAARTRSDAAPGDDAGRNSPSSNDR